MNKLEPRLLCGMDRTLTGFYSLSLYLKKIKKVLLTSQESQKGKHDDRLNLCFSWKNKVSEFKVSLLFMLVKL